MQHPQFALQYPQHFRYFTNSAENCAVAECECTMDSLKGWQIPSQRVALYSIDIPQDTRELTCSLIYLKINYMHLLWSLVATEGQSLLSLTLSFSLPQHRYKKDF